MNVSRENIDSLNALLKVQVSKEDYEEKVEKVLRDYRRKATFDGFRPGKVPFGLVSKLYRKSVLVDEINKLVSESVGHYIESEKIQILGEPLPNEERHKDIDWDHQQDFEFVFDIGLAPEFSVELSQKVKMPLYTIKVDQEMIDKSVDDIARRYGKFTEMETIEAEEMLKGDLIAADEADNPAEGGIITEDAVLSVSAIKDEEIKKSFIGKKVSDTIIFNLKKAFPLDTDRVGLLRVDKKDVHKTNGNFIFTIKEIKQYGKADINQELFDKVYGKDIVNSEEEFRRKIAEELEKSLVNDSEYRFSVDAKETLLDKVKIDLPGEFLKRWMLHANEGKVTQEQIDHDFRHFEEDLKWQLIIGKIAKENNILLSEEELKEYTTQVARRQFERYGMYNVADENLNNYVNDVLNKPEERRRLSERKLEEKIITFVKETIKIENKFVTAEEFNKLFEK